MANVTVNIQGVALVYRVDEQTDSRWRVLFPFDKCHTVALSYELVPDKPVFLGNFGQPGAKLAIRTSGPLVPPTSTEDFDSYVLDMTSGKTHAEGVRKNRDWDQHSALLSIDSARFSVWNYLQDYSKDVPYDVFLTDGDQVLEKQNKLAYSVKASIELGPGEFFRIEVNGKELFVGEPDVSYTLLVDNDCKEDPNALPVASANKPGDMNMYYGVFSDASKPMRRFGIRGQKSSAFLQAEASAKEMGDIEIASINPHFAHTDTAPFGRHPDKPCMSVRASKPIDFPT